VKAALVNGAWIYTVIRTMTPVDDSGSGSGIVAVTVATVVGSATVVNTTVLIVLRMTIRLILLPRRLQRVHLRVAVVLRGRRHCH